MVEIRLQFSPEWERAALIGSQMATMQVPTAKPNFSLTAERYKQE